MRALVRYKQLEYKKAEAEWTEGATGTTEMKKQPEVTAIDYEVEEMTLDHVIQLALILFMAIATVAMCLRY